MKSFIIKSKHGNFLVKIDDEDYNRVMNHGWCINIGNKYNYKRVECTIKYKRIRLHRFILNITDSKQHIDHIDGDTLNNQKSNLRLCTHPQNMRNSKIRFNKTGYIGVYKEGNKYRASISVKNKTKHIPGSFNTPEEAAKARDDYALKISGEFAKLNFNKKGERPCGE